MLFLSSESIYKWGTTMFNEAVNILIIINKEMIDECVVGHWDSAQTNCSDEVNLLMKSLNKSQWTDFTDGTCEQTEASHHE